tara:strand:- start:367 stop:558 length:192 start_codon:yes stop_codon:yes gene_type:complete
MTQTKIKLNRESQLFYKACGEVRDLPECNDYIVFKELSRKLWLALLLKEDLIDIKEYVKELQA